MQEIISGQGHSSAVDWWALGEASHLMVNLLRPACIFIRSEGPNSYHAIGQITS